MPKKEEKIEVLQQYLPEGTFDAIYTYLRDYHVHLTISERPFCLQRSRIE